MGSDQLPSKSHVNNVNPKFKFKIPNLSKVDAETRPSVVGPPFTGHFIVTTDSPRGLQPFQPSPKPITSEAKPYGNTDLAIAENRTPASKFAENIELRRNIFESNGKELPINKKQANGEEGATNGATDVEGATKSAEDAVKEPKKPVFCHTCGVDCTRVRFHRARFSKAAAAVATTKYDICPNCYKHGRFSGDGQSIDYVKIEDSSYTQLPDRDSPWTDAELLKLLEGLEAFDLEWNQIASYVDTRTREECVMKFLQLEIEDPYLGETNTKHSSFDALNYGRVPFDRAENPVMSVISYLATISDPAVTAATSGRTIETLKKILIRQLEHGNIEGIPKDKGKEKSTEPSKEVKPETESDTMDVDTIPTTTSQPTSDSQAIDLSLDKPVPIPTIPLAGSAARAFGLATSEERQMTRLVHAAVNTTLQKFELKLKQFTEMESILQAERLELEKGQQQLFLDRLAFKKRVREVNDRMRRQSVSAAAGETGGQEEKLGFFSVNGRAEEDMRPLATGDTGFRSLEI